METGKILCLGEEEVRQCLDIPRAIRLMERALCEHADGRVHNRPPLHLSERPHRDAYLDCMPAYLADSNLLGVKVEQLVRGNPGKGLPASVGVLMLHHPQTGVPYCFMSAGYLTGVRTGAMAGVQAKYLAKKDSRTLATLGGGAAGSASLAGIAAVSGALEEVRLAEPDDRAAEAFIARGEKEHPGFRFMRFRTPEEAASHADIIVSCTTSVDFVLDAAHPEKGALIIDLSAPSVRWKRLQTIADRMIVDDPEAFLSRRNQEEKWNARVRGEPFEPVAFDVPPVTLGQVLQGRQAGRVSEDEVIWCGTVGLGMEDLKAAAFVYEAARDKCLGVQVEFLDL